MKIALVGYTGSGKSTLARELGRRRGIPVLHLDKVHWTAGWNERDEAEKEQMVREFMDNNEDWIIDGNYSDLLYEKRLEEADRIILLMFGRWTCLFRAFRRWLKYRGKTRPDMGAGCNEKFDWDFVKWILRDSRTPKRRGRFEEIPIKYPEKVTVIRNQKQLNQWMQDEM